MLTEEQKLEIGRMLREGVSDEGIRAVVDAWQLSKGEYLQTYQYIMHEAHRPTYAFYVEFGLPPIDESKTVEGSIALKELSRPKEEK